MGAVIMFKICHSIKEFLLFFDKNMNVISISLKKKHNKKIIIVTVGPHKALKCVTYPS